MAHEAVKPGVTWEPCATCSCERRCAKSMGGETYVGCGTGNSLGGAGRVLTSQPFAEAGGGMSVRRFAGRPGDLACFIPKIRGDPDVPAVVPGQRGDLPLPQWQPGVPGDPVTEGPKQ